MKFSAKKILLLGFVIVLLVAIPITVYLVQQQVKTTTGAVPATNLSLSPQNKTAKVGEDMSFDITINPGSNQVSFVKILISYDATKLATSGGGFIPNPAVFPSVLQGPTYGPNTISVSLSVGSSPQSIISQVAKVGTVTFKALDATDTATKVTFGNQTQVLSIASTDQFNENVLSTTVPATISIQSDTGATPTPEDQQLASTQRLNSTVSPTKEPTPTEEPIPTEDPTQEVNLELTPTDTPEPTSTLLAQADISPTLTPTPATQSANSKPVCATLTVDRSTTGAAPYNVNFIITGTSTADISKVTFNFGDTKTLDVTQQQGIGSTSLNLLQSHIYNAAGVFVASATITDVNGLVSDVGPCSQTLTINSILSPSPLPVTGPSSSLITLGLLGAILTVIGAVLLFAL